jgi:Flp pilus assembly CpaE family ATPase
VRSDLSLHLDTRRDSGAVAAEHLSVALIGPDRERRHVLARALADSRLATVSEFLSYPSRLDEFDSLLEQSFGLIVIDLDSDPNTALELVERVSASGVAPVMVFSENRDTRQAVRCMRAGASEFLLLPLEQGGLEEALAQATSAPRPAAHPAGVARSKASLAKRTRGGLLVFLGAKGGSGVTTISCNLAIALARESDQKTLLIDLAAPIGDAALTLGIATDYSTEDAFRDVERLDARFLQALLVEHSSGLFVLAAPSKVPEIEASKAAVDKLIAVARREFDHVIVDLGSRIDVAGTVLFREASTIYLVTLTGVSDLRNANRLISRFFPEGGPQLETVINRFEPRSAGGVSKDVIAEALRRPVRWTVPNDQDAAREMQNGEIGLAKTRISRLGLEMAGSINGRPVAQEKKKRFGLKAIGKSIADEDEGKAGRPAITILPSPHSRAASIIGLELSSKSIADEDADKTWRPAVMPSRHVRATPMIRWQTPDPIVYGDTLSTAQLNATASVPGSFDYSPPLGELLSAGTPTLLVTFTPADGEHHATTQAAVSLKVEKATPVIAWADPDPIRYGARLSATQLCAKASVAGTFDYCPGPGEALPAGTHALSVTFTPTDCANFATTKATVQLKVAKANLAVTWPDPDPVLYGTELDSRQLNARASIPGTFDYSPGPGEVLAAGLHTLSATFTPADSTNFSAKQATVSLKVAKAAPVIEWPNPAPMAYGEPLSATELNAVAPVPGTLEYSPAAGEVLPPGTHALKVSFTPADSANYTATKTTVSLKVAKAAPEITWPDPDPIVYGARLGAMQLCARTSTPGTFEYSPATGERLSAGMHTLSVTFTPEDSANFAPAQTSVTLKVVKAMPAILWPNPNPIVYGARLGAAQLYATASVPGTFEYTPPPGGVLPLGSNTLSDVFTPTDTANYEAAQAAVSLKVDKATPVIAWSNPDAIPFGTRLGAAQLCARASTPGTFDYSPEPGRVLAAGTHTLTATFTPADRTNYTTAKASVSLKVDKAAPEIEWRRPDPILYGTQLSATQLCATASMPGTFDYRPAPGDVLPAGLHTLTVIFTPTDSVNHGTIKATAILKVDKATPAISWPPPKPVQHGTALGAAQLHATAKIPGAFVYSPSAGHVLQPGNNTLSVLFIPSDAENYMASQATVELEVQESPQFAPLSAAASRKRSWWTSDADDSISEDSTPAEETGRGAVAGTNPFWRYDEREEIPARVPDAPREVRSSSPANAPSDDHPLLQKRESTNEMVNRLPGPGYKLEPSYLNDEYPIAPRPRQAERDDEWDVIGIREADTPLYRSFPNREMREEKPESKSWMILGAVSACAILALLIFVFTLFNLGTKSTAVQPVQPPPPAAIAEPQSKPARQSHRTQSSRARPLAKAPVQPARPSTAAAAQPTAAVPPASAEDPVKPGRTRF